MNMAAPTHTHDHSTCHECYGHVTNPSVHQTLDELDFERGIWNSALLGDVADVEAKLMKSSGADVNSVDKSGYTALHYACRNGHLEICEKLLAYGAQVNATTCSSRATPLHRAAYMGHSRIVSLLLDHHADPSVHDCDGLTPMHKAAERGHLKTMRILAMTDRSLLDIEDNQGRKPERLIAPDKLEAWMEEKQCILSLTPT